MNAEHGISSSRAVWLIGRLALRRQLNIWQNMRRGKKKPIPPTEQTHPATKRTATPAKTRGGSIFGAFIFLMMLFNGFNITSMGLPKIAAAIANRGDLFDKILVSARVKADLVQAEQQLHDLERGLPPSAHKTFINEVIWKGEIEAPLRAEAKLQSLTGEDENARLKQMHDVFAQKGAAGFAAASEPEFHLSSKTWPRDSRARTVFLRVIGWMTLFWFLGTVFLSLGTNNKDLGNVEWSFEWLFTFPVSARALFASRLASAVFMNPLAWVFFFPLPIMAAVAGGHGWMSLPIGLSGFVWTMILAGATSTLAEVLMRKTLSLNRLKNAQALFTVLGGFFPLLALALSFSTPVIGFLVSRVASSVVTDWNLFSLPLRVGLPAATMPQIWGSILGMMVVAIAAVSATLVGSEWLTRDGLVRSAGPYQGSRKSRRGGAGNIRLHGIAAHEMLLLARDRNFMVQVLVLPLLAPVFYLLAYSGIVTSVRSNPRHAATLAFVIGAYTFLSSAMAVLSRETKTLWYLLTFPQSLASMLLKKTTVWAAVGLLYGGAALCLAVRLGHSSFAGIWGNAFFALYGIALYAFIAAGIGILATDVLETNISTRISPEMVYLYFLLAGMWATTIYAPSLWTKLAQLVVTTLVAFALWQKVADISPYLLDPTDRPPRTLSLADGLIAALGFFVVQTLLVLIFHWIEWWSPSEQITIAYSLAGIIVASFTLLTLWWEETPNLWKSIGIVRGDGSQLPVWQGLLLGAALGGLAALGAYVYLEVLKLSPEWTRWKQSAEMNSLLAGSGNSLWIFALAIAAAPLCEEFLFRGLIFKGLLRSTGPVLAVLGSAAIFALVHPAISVVPVFGLGISAALGFRKSGLLLAPIVTHAVYNACIVFLNK